MREPALEHVEPDLISPRDRMVTHCEPERGIRVDPAPDEPRRRHAIDLYSCPGDPRRALV